MEDEESYYMSVPTLFAATADTITVTSPVLLFLRSNYFSRASAPTSAPTADSTAVPARITSISA